MTNAAVKTESFIDKAGWRPGPWIDEPDRVEWRHLGFACLIVRNGFGALCGYVGVPPGHPWHGQGHDDVRTAGNEWPEVHGGLTYAAPCDDGGKICHVPAPGEDANVWWLGFDCAHFGDYTLMNVGPQHGLDPDNTETGSGTYRRIEYVRADVESLAGQAEAAA